MRGLRRTFLLLGVLNGCARPVPAIAPAPVVAPVATAPCPTCVACPTPPATAPPPLVAVAEPGDPKEEALVLRTLFPRHLKNLRECRKGRSSNTFVEADDVALRNLDSGQFVPVVESRETFSDEGKNQVGFVIRLDNCEQSDDETRHVEAVFDAWALDPEGGLAKGRRPRPVSQREW